MQKTKKQLKKRSKNIKRLTVYCSLFVILLFGTAQHTECVELDLLMIPSAMSDRAVNLPPDHHVFVEHGGSYGAVAGNGSFFDER